MTYRDFIPTQRLSSALLSHLSNINYNMYNYARRIVNKPELYYHS